MRLIDLDAIPEDEYWCRDALAEALENAPIIEERRKGKWIRTDMTDIVDGKCINWVKWNCSECGVQKKIGWAKGVKFCPNCGALMGGKENV